MNSPASGLEVTSDAPSGDVQSGHNSAGSGSAAALRVQRAVHRLMIGRIANLRVYVEQEQLILQGKTKSFYCKQLAQHAAMQLSEGMQVVNRIDVA